MQRYLRFLLLTQTRIQRCKLFVSVPCRVLATEQHKEIVHVELPWVQEITSNQNTPIRLAES